ncbi:hypothetical protein D3C87_431050 [compost metagenome]
MKSLLFLALISLSFFSQAQNSEITDRVLSLLTVKVKHTPREYPMDNEVNFLQIENGEAMIYYRSRGRVTFYQGMVEKYTAQKTETGETISFYLSPTGLGSKQVSLEINLRETGTHSIHLFEPLGSRDVYLTAETASKEILKD